MLQSSTGWAVFGIAAGAVLCHCLIEIIYHFDFRRLFDHKVQLAVCMMGGLAVLFCFKNDWMGYDTYLPEKETVAELLLVDDDTMMLSEELLKGLDEELDDFLEKLLKE